MRCEIVPEELFPYFSCHRHYKAAKLPGGNRSDRGEAVSAAPRLIEAAGK